MIRPLNDRVAVAPQITPADLPAIAAAGYVAIVNNRPDGEEPGQPTGEAIRAAAEAAGLRYTAIPIDQSGFSQPQLDAMTGALAQAEGPVLAYCRSGTRSCNLWALAAAKSGRDPALLVAQAAGAGYDLNGLRPTLDALAGGR
ncbi:TIGR01244 family sulfur transferase [Sphingomonas sp. KR1UV-12]|uniref:TIGR01244 family sulfur transferase n=1 Tax=Sphingomonas aurea TaxID=3063994 RepID=A0ABT9EPU8_9SPHN|nr:TIGR01244 family sulfur transferase [Sphingomonas sp. KR1UV-12]MDP1028673.1 TIGR01244 family sulfur transferase [Sphingomonas sp. KR1UV-12]